MILTVLVVALAVYILLGLLGTLLYAVFVAPYDSSGDGAGVLIIAWVWPYAFVYLPIKWKLQALFTRKERRSEGAKERRSEGAKERR
jgi:hypothetical protein